MAERESDRTPENACVLARKLNAVGGGIFLIWMGIAFLAAGGARFHYHDLRARSVGKRNADGRQERAITGHATEATAERIYDRRTAKRGRAVE